MPDLKPIAYRAISRLIKKQEEVQYKIKLLSGARTISFAFIFVVPFSLNWIYPESFFWIKIFGAMICTILFFLLILLTGKFQKSKALIQNLILYHKNSVLRIEGKWQTANSINLGEHSDHSYANDLLVVGPFSLLQFMDRCSTRQGSLKLEHLFLNQPDQTSLDARLWELRQSAIRELSRKKVMRMRWVRASKQLEDELQNAKINWQESLESLRIPISHKLKFILVPLLFILSSITIITYPLAQMDLFASWYLLSFPIQVIVFFYFAWKVNPISHTMTKLSNELGQLHLHFEKIQDIKLSSSFWDDYSIFQKTPAIAISNLTRLGGYFMLRNNPLVHGFFGILFFYEVVLIFRLERWLNSYKNHLQKWLHEIAVLDAFISISSLLDTDSKIIFPKWMENKNQPTIEAKNCRHPLLPIKENIGNDLNMVPSTWILTGSNMSGKSTFLRTVGLNYLLALCGAPVFADSYKMFPGGIITSMQHVDSLKNSYSLFYSEVRRLKSIQEFTEKNTGIILIDEMLRGTNSRERKIAQDGFLKKLEESSSIVIVATHDIDLATQKNNRVTMHFRETIVNHKMVFDYKLHNGIVETSNALKILKQEGIHI